MEYKTVGTPGQEHTLPILPNQSPSSRYRKLIRELTEERGEELSAKEQEYIANKIAFGDLPPLDAAKCMLANAGGGDLYLQEVAQQALDENPNDFHTLLIWTDAQPYDSENREKGYRQLLQMRPNAAYVLLMLGECMKFKNRQESIELYKKAAQYAPNTRLGARATLGGRSGFIYEIGHFRS